MALTDIPEFIKANPGDLITAKSWDDMQKMMRSSLRLHQHIRPAGTAPTDTDTTDNADQISTGEIADGAVTAAKLASGSISTDSLPDGAVTTAKLQDGAVSTAKLGNASVTSAKLSFASVGAATGGSAVVGAQVTVEVLVAAGLAGTKTQIYFPSIMLTGTSGASPAAVTALLLYKQTAGANTVDLYLRLYNSGGASTSVFWQVHTFGQ